MGADKKETNFIDTICYALDWAVNVKKLIIQMILAAENSPTSGSVVALASRGRGGRVAREAGAGWRHRRRQVRAPVCVRRHPPAPTNDQRERRPMTHRSLPTRTQHPRGSAWDATTVSYIKSITRV